MADVEASGTETVRRSVSLPADLVDRITAAAHEAKRSVNAEIWNTLAQAYPAPEAEQQNGQAVHDALSAVKPRAFRPRGGR